MKKILTLLWVTAIAVTCRSTLVARPVPDLVFCCKAENDLFRVAIQQWPGLVRVDTTDAALEQAPRGAGVLILADGYPGTRNSLTAGQLTTATGKQLRVYLEYPASMPGLRLGEPRAAEWERAVVASEAMSPALPKFSILALHGGTFVPIVSTTPVQSHVVMAKVAGFDKAVYGLPSTVYPILFEHSADNSPMLVATTKLSQFVTARYAPKAAWQSVWKLVFEWLRPGETIPLLDWNLAVHPTYTKTESLPTNAVEEAIIRGIDWHTRARMLMHPSWTNEYAKYGNLANPLGPRPDANWPSGEGECGLLEGFNSRVFSDGSQNVRWWLRTDCNGESALSFALRSRLDGDTRSARIATNLLDWVYFNSKLLHNEINSPTYGLLGWAPNTTGTFFQDNDIKAILGCIGAAALLQTDRWGEALLKNILANFRTTGVYGFRGECLNEPGLRQNGWLHYWQAPTLHYSAHFEVWTWAGYLWLYDKTRFAPLLDRTKTGIRRMMAAYPSQWRWTNGLQQERGRMILALAWLVRVEDTAEHREWLRRVATDMIADQAECGAIREEMGELSLGYMKPPQSNEAYGSGEAPLIHQNGDPVADLLYTCNFALFGLHEAAAATGDPFYRAAEEKLIDFLLRVQVRSELRPELDGAWFRAFDFERWDYFASNSDWGWGAWAVECGWTQGWITTGLALYRLGLNVWDLSKDSGIARHMDKVRPIMLPDDKIPVPSPNRKVFHDAVGHPPMALTPPDPRYPGLGSEELTDGLICASHFRNPWLGYEGIDAEATLDLGRVVRVQKVEINCLQETSVGIYLPARLEVAVSTNGTDYTTLAPVTHQVAATVPGPATYLIGKTNLDVPARFVKLRAVNRKQIPPGQPGAGLKAWLFIDEILVNQRPGPSLSWLRKGDELTLSWSDPRYVLQQNATIQTATDWADVDNGRVSPVTLAIQDAGADFYRLVNR